MTQLSSRLVAFGVASFAALACLASSASAQSFNNQWLTYVNETATRLGPAPTSVSSNNDEIDLAAGDFDKDGWVDLVVARKQPFTNGGKRPNMLLMNEHGKLVDRTSQFAATSDIPTDLGLLQPTNNRDVIAVDVNLDGWLDIVTSPTISGGTDPKWINHPRVYRNLGDDANGDWLGVKFENVRIPQLLVGATPASANGCSILAGDVTGDGFPELYLVDYDAGDMGGDTQDRLLVNDGNGFFVDGSAAVSSVMKTSDFGTAGAIVDLNGDGVNDIMKSMAGPVIVVYNSYTSPGQLQLVQTPNSGSNYNMAAGDLNNDDKVDFIVSDDGFDHYRYNTGNDALGRVSWGPAKTYTFLAGGDDSIGGNAHVVDLDGDGWKDTVHNDVDVDIPGCERRVHLYHNPTGTPGAQITLVEERENSTATSWLGAKGLKSADLGGGYDSAHFDVDNDGDLDLILGRCAGTYVWSNQKNPVTCQPVIAPASKGDGSVTACGAPLWTGLSSTLAVANGPAGGIALVLVAGSPAQVPALGGQVLAPFLFAVVLPLDGAGALSLPIPGGGGTPEGVSLYVQGVLVPPASSSPTDLTNVVRLVFLD